jgi:hypothetical protein
MRISSCTCEDRSAKSGTMAWLCPRDGQRVGSQQSNWRESVLHCSHVCRRQREQFLTPNRGKAELIGWGPRSAVLLPDAFSHMGRSAFGATAHDAVHGAVHDAFMTLPAYTRISEGEVQEPGLGVRNCSHSALFDPWSEQSERIERAVKALQPKGQRVAHPVGNPFQGGFSCPRAQKEAGALPRGVPSGRAHGRQLC